MALHDQTRQEWIDPTNPSELGTGLILEAVDQGGLQAFQVNLTENRTYEQCRNAAAGKISFKWIPLRVARPDALRWARCGGPCTDTCVKEGCMCGPAGICVPVNP